MIVSIIIATQGKKTRLVESFYSIQQQTNSNYEIIVINEGSDNECEQLLRQEFLRNKNLKVVFNTKNQGTAYAWNIGIELVSGRYFVFLKEGNTIDPNFVQRIEDVIKSNSEKVDIMEFTIQYTKLSDSKSDSVLKSDHLYNLKTDFDPFAYTNPIIYNKLFRTDFIRENNFSFRRFTRFDALFVYKALGQATNYLYISEVLMNHRLSVMRYSAFDLVNQWPHIMNYYRRVGKFKKLKDEITYAYYKDLIYRFLWMITKFDNKILVKKGVAFVERKIGNKLDEIKENPVFLKNLEPEFGKIVSNLKDYFKDILKNS
ncbi:glycosyltransferase [Spiroplasma sabaudiense Ar-1343]|uniref:Glycosyltransferase n=1 Tax=Spiroplasma sabaudiense Ar-1343 TaxID=1276257 RepID=W6A913_9MOLU|nr:glycosyltransferase family 2 protein [Spiroplasma sabaudiense]AHI53502.1 glycosyltransferase [Spiroplasma sabaudiense Ar-1343]